MSACGSYDLTCQVWVETSLRVEKKAYHYRLRWGGSRDGSNWNDYNFHSLSEFIGEVEHLIAQGMVLVSMQVSPGQPLKDSHSYKKHYNIV